MAIFTPEVDVQGSVDVNNFPAVQPVSGTVTATGPLTDTQLRATPVPISGTVSTSAVLSSTSAVTQVTSTGANQTLLAANPSRTKAILYFETGIWYLKLGATASASSLTYKISANNTSLEIPASWVGIIDALCTTAGKLVDVTELH